MDIIKRFSDLPPRLKQQINHQFDFLSESEKLLFVDVYHRGIFETALEIKTALLQVEKSVKLNDGTFMEGLEFLVEDLDNIMKSCQEKQETSPTLESYKQELLSSMINADEESQGVEHDE